MNLRNTIQILFISFFFLFLQASILNKYKNKLNSPNHLFIADSLIPNSGRGVFTKRSIKKHRLVEHCPLLLVEKSIMNTKLGDYVFKAKYHNSTKFTVLALGFCSMYNHNETANVYRKLDNSFFNSNFKTIQRFDHEIFCESRNQTRRRIVH
jgi:hypothetical protein